MSKEVTAAGILQSLPKDSLDLQVSEEHIAKIACQMRRWEVYMPDLIGEDAEAAEEEIKHDYKNNYGRQKLEALRRGKASLGVVPPIVESLLCFVKLNS